MSIKQEIETWVSALAHYDNNQYEDAIAVFQPIADTSKILFNCGVIRASLGEHEAAVNFYQRAVSLDQYLAVAYFQQGVSNFLIGQFEEALTNFNDTLLYLRGNRNIDYEQLGLRFKLHSCEALFNRGLCYIHTQQIEAGLTDLTYAGREKATTSHDVIDDAIRDRAVGYTVFSISVGVVFRPSSAKIKNVHIRDYLGKARLIAKASDPNMIAQRKNSATEQWTIHDRPVDMLSYAATNLVRSGLRSRQQSAPPMHRDPLPPTPPPEAEKPTNSRPQRPLSPGGPAHTTGRSRSLSRRPERLELGPASFDTTPSEEASTRPRIVRSASERPSIRIPERPLAALASMYREDLTNIQDGTTQNSQQAGLDNSPQRQHRSFSKSHTFPRHLQLHRPASIEEEQEGLQFPNTRADSSAASSYPGTPSEAGTLPRSQSTTQSVYSSSLHGSTNMDVIRLKVHYGDDTRYFTIQPTTGFPELEAHIARKFHTQRDLRIKTRDDDGDMITMADQEDLETAIAMSMDGANREARSAAKIEVWVHDL